MEHSQKPRLVYVHVSQKIWSSYANYHYRSQPVWRVPQAHGPAQKTHGKDFYRMLHTEKRTRQIATDKIMFVVGLFSDCQKHSVNNFSEKTTFFVQYLRATRRWDSNPQPHV